MLIIQTVTNAFYIFFLFLVNVACCQLQLTLRREVGVKLTPGPINCLILKNGFNLYRPDFVTFNIYLLPSI